MARRHWKQKWDPSPDANYVFLKRMKLGLDPKQPYVNAGDPVPKGDVRLGRGRLKKWWAAEVIGLAGWGPSGKEDPNAKPRPKPPESLPEGEVTTIPEHGATLEAVGDGTFQVTRGDSPPATLGTLADAVLYARTGIMVEGPGGGGWYEIHIPGEEQPKKIQGRTALDAFLAEAGG